MNIVVCVKQVPATQKVEVDPVTGVLKRDGIETKMNPYDLYAMETALQIRKKTGAKIHVITMWPPAAKAVVPKLTTIIPAITNAINFFMLVSSLEVFPLRGFHQEYESASRFHSPLQKIFYFFKPRLPV